MKGAIISNITNVDHPADMGKVL